MPGSNCAIVGCPACKGRNRGLSFHKIRKHDDPEWERALINAVNRADASFNKDTATICSRHFKPECIQVGKNGGRTLVHGSLPTECMPETFIMIHRTTRAAPVAHDPPEEPLPGKCFHLNDVQKDCSSLPTSEDEVALACPEGEAAEGVENPPSLKGTTDHGDDTWTFEASKLLISLHAVHKDSFNNPTLKRTHCWKLVSAAMEEHGIVKSGTECANKWRSLKSRYKQILSYAQRTGRKRRRTWPLYQYMHEVLQDDPTIHPQCLLQKGAPQSPPTTPQPSSPSSHSTTSLSSEHHATSNLPSSPPSTQCTYHQLSSSTSTWCTTHLSSSSLLAHCTTRLPSSSPSTQSTTHLPSSSLLAQHTSHLPSSSPFTQCTTHLPSSSPSTQSTTHLPSSSLLAQHTTRLPSSSLLAQHTTRLPSSSLLAQSTTHLPSSSLSTQSTTRLPSSSLLAQCTTRLPSSSLSTQSTTRLPSSSLPARCTTHLPSSSLSTQSTTRLPSSSLSTQSTTHLPSSSLSTQSTTHLPSSSLLAQCTTCLPSSSLFTQSTTRLTSSSLPKECTPHLPSSSLCIQSTSSAVPADQTASSQYSSSDSTSPDHWKPVRGLRRKQPCKRKADNIATIQHEWWETWKEHSVRLERLIEEQNRLLENRNRIMQERNDLLREFLPMHKN